MLILPKVITYSDKSNILKIAQNKKILLNLNLIFFYELPLFLSSLSPTAEFPNARCSLSINTVQIHANKGDQQNELLAITALSTREHSNLSTSPAFSKCLVYVQSTV